MRLLNNLRFLPDLRRSGSVIRSPGRIIRRTGCIVHRPAHRFPAHIDGVVHRPGDVLVQGSIILRIDGLINDLLYIPAQRFPILIVVRHTLHSTH